MSLNMEYHSIWLVTQNGMSLQNGMSFKMEYPSNLNVTQKGLSLQMECHPKSNVTQKGMSLKIECH